MLIHWIWLSRLPQVTNRQKRMLLQVFRNPEDIYKATEDAFLSVGGLTEKNIVSLLDKDLSQARQILSDCNEKNIGILTYGDGAYPSKLKNIEQPPLVLYYKGCLPDWEMVPVIAMVGTRKATAYGLNTAQRVGFQIASCGALVISGGANGIDAWALQGAMEAGKRVVAVLGCGADMVYPAKNKDLFGKIEKQGCILSEYVPGTPPYTWNFLQRNRIISGISNGVLVVEAPERSGALNTVKHALEQGRDVFAVPGNVNNPSCAGSNQLLGAQALPAYTGWDVMREYAALYPDAVTRFEQPYPDTFRMEQTPVYPEPVEKVRNKSIDNREKSRYSVEDNQRKSLSEQERAVYDCLSITPKPVDEIIAALEMPAGKVLSILTVLAMKGLVKNHPGKLVSK